MSRLQMKYFGKHSKKKKVSKLARRRSIGARNYYRYPRVRRASARVGGFKSMLAPIVAGLADSYLDPMLPIDGIGATAVGMFLHNSTMRDIGLYKVGLSARNVIPLPGIGGSQGVML